MKLQQLEILVAAVECGTLTKAASQLFLAQPVLSLSIKDFEQELGVTLLQRGATGVEPTPVGIEVYHHAKKVLSLLEETQNISAELEHRIPAVCFTSTFFVGYLLLIETYASLQKKGIDCRHYDFSTRENRMSVKQLLHAIEQGHLSFAVMGFDNYRAQAEVRALENRGFHAEYLGIDPVYLIAREGHPLAKGEVSLPSLRHYPYAVYENDLNDYIQSAYGKEYCQKKCVCIENIIGLRNYLLQTDAISALTKAELIHGNATNQGEFQVLQASKIQWHRQLYCVRLKGEQSHLEQQFLQELLSVTPQWISNDDIKI